MSSQGSDIPAIVSVEANFLPSHDNDAMFDGIVEYLKTNRYPSFIKLTTDKAAAKSVFRKKCSMFFLDKNGDLIQGRAAGVHRNVLRRGELATVFHFVHEALGHCSADVCVKVVSPSLWSSENMDLAAHDEIKRCGCRRHCFSLRSACSLETARFVSLKFIRNVSGGFSITLRSTSRDVDFSRFQSAAGGDVAQRKEKQKKDKSPILIDGRYRIYGSAEMEDVLEKLHVAFVHCAVNNLRILFKSRFYCLGFSNAASDVYSRCWFCKTEGRKKHRFPIKCFEYDVIVQGDINDASRNFIIKPRGISSEEAEQFMALVLGSCVGTITLDEAANMADTSSEVSPSTKKRKLGEKMRREITKRKQEQLLRGELNPTIHVDIGNKRKKKETIYSDTGPNAKKSCRLIPPSEISLGPSPTNDWSDTDSSACGGSQNTSTSTGCNSADQRSGTELQLRNVETQPVHQIPLFQETYSPYQTDINHNRIGQISEEEIQRDNHCCNPSVGIDDADFSEGEVAQGEQRTPIEEFSELQPVESQCLTFLLDYDADFACDTYTQAPEPAVSCVTNADGADLTDPLEDLRDLSLDSFANLFASGEDAYVEPWYNLTGPFGPF